MDRLRFMKGSPTLGLAMEVAKAQAPGQSAGKPSLRTRTDLWLAELDPWFRCPCKWKPAPRPIAALVGHGALWTRSIRTLPTEKWYEYGFKEGTPRLLDMYDRRKVKVTSHMVGMAVEKHPALAKEIVQRDHEPAAHGRTWEPIYAKTPFEERASYQANVQAIERATGIRPIGFNAPGLRVTPETFGILQDLGFLYHTDDLSRDEPFVIAVKSKPLCSRALHVLAQRFSKFREPVAHMQRFRGRA